MPSLKQLEANRLNAQKSTGPRSVTGKAASSMNPLKSGIYAQSLVIPGENAADLKALAAEYFDRFQPAGPEERCLVDTLVHSDWLLRRLHRAESQLWILDQKDRSHPDKDCPLAQTASAKSETFARLQRRVDSTNRNFDRALARLTRIQSARRQAPLAAEPCPAVGFVPSDSPAPLISALDPSHTLPINNLWETECPTPVRSKSALLPNSPCLNGPILGLPVDHLPVCEAMRLARQIAEVAHHGSEMLDMALMSARITKIASTVRS
jgi:hypothetical protein